MTGPKSRLESRRDFLGGARKEVPLYVTFGPAFLNRDELVDVAKAMTAQGFGGAGALQNMHMHAGLSNGGFCEWHLPFMGLCRHIYRNMPEPGAGKIAIPAAAGLGFEPDRDAIRDVTLKG